MKPLCLAFGLALLSPAFAADKAKEDLPLLTTGTWKHEELKRFQAPEAKQGVAADDEHIYVITNRALGKYRKDTLERVGEWKDAEGGPFIHMNSGIIHEGKLLCTHSNFPSVPMTSSIEIFDPKTMTHVGTHSLGIDSGSLTWITWHDGHWYACFAHYSKSQPATGRDPAWTELVRFDPEWRRTGGWVFPKRIVEIFGSSSSSGGSIAPDGTLFITGHDARQLFILRFPKAGSVLEWTDTIPITAAGQAFAWDPVQPDLFYSILRSSQEVVISRIRGHRRPSQPR